MKKQTNQKKESASQKESALSGFIGAAGTILTISYPILALSTGARASVRLLRGETTYLPDGLSALAASFYLIATIGLAYRRPWGWYLSVSVLFLETLCTLVVGGLSIAYPEIIGRTAWRHFGADYGYFPLVQPLLGLAWLFHPQTLQAYGVQPRWLRWLVKNEEQPSATS
jgi:hypothetical protein